MESLKTHHPMQAKEQKEIHQRFIRKLIDWFSHLQQQRLLYQLKQIPSLLFLQLLFMQKKLNSVKCQFFPSKMVSKQNLFINYHMIISIISTKNDQKGEKYNFFLIKYLLQFVIYFSQQVLNYVFLYLFIFCLFV
ncbi:transmembrane protein, putative (macronuclear) [Tetrahymena thermophila SB210]|uniref:Transmembrane protein, putative n=1 Tax=Tetrahymena thermophila (strain SB210) TaxID=312017 RepID=W7X9N2_TETTS|nr:transmembrane protein, putative [Tetrahymena thermophila SB210]EWS74052.1 transmembrane protein, putative [Tetrahymena thermophila SB210]|eukprot:XP_012653385.1 transmembrane protein, putative [Tetrahymena thermophila SB210]